MPDPEALIEMLEAIAATLNAHGETHWAKRLTEDAGGLRRGDPAALDRFLGSFGGMGSLNDLILCPENGHRIDKAEVQTKNEQLMRALSAASKLARSLKT